LEWGEVRGTRCEVDRLDGNKERSTSRQPLRGTMFLAPHGILGSSGAMYIVKLISPLWVSSSPVRSSCKPASFFGPDKQRVFRSVPAARHPDKPIKALNSDLSNSIFCMVRPKSRDSLAGEHATRSNLDFFGHADRQRRAASLPCQAWAGATEAPAATSSIPCSEKEYAASMAYR